MARSGVRVLRFAIVATVLIILVYKLSTHNVDVSDYVASKPSVQGTTGNVNGDNSQDPALNQQEQNQQGEEGDGQPAVEVIVPKPDAESKDQTADLNHPQTKAPYQRANATFVSLVRNSDLYSMIGSIRQIEDRFNENYGYDWVFLNDQPFSDEFKNKISSMVSGQAHFGLIPKEQWSFPDWIDQDRAALVREEMRQQKVIYGDSISYRHMCRFESGFFWRHPLLDNYKYYWRVEPEIKIFCNIKYDLFKYMEENDKQYGFAISLYEYIETIPTLWKTTKEFITANPQYVAPDSLMEWVSEDGGETYNRCHFWSNFEIASLDFWRGEAYRKYFDHLDKNGGFFYERWGDAPVHSIAAALFLNKTQVHYFGDVGYWHVPFHNCPTSEKDRDELQCVCNPSDNFAWKGYSCTPRFHKVAGIERPEGWSKQAD